MTHSAASKCRFVGAVLVIALCSTGLVTSSIDLAQWPSWTLGNCTLSFDQPQIQDHADNHGCYIDPTGQYPPRSDSGWRERRNYRIQVALWAAMVVGSLIGVAYVYTRPSSQMIPNGNLAALTAELANPDQLVFSS